MKKQDKIFVNEISVKEISSILSKIDDQIIDLYNCSSNDFMNLYADFKKFYNDSNGISDRAKEIFRLLSEENNKTLFLDLQELYKDLNKLQGLFHRNLNITSNGLKNVQSHFDQLFIPIKNLKQNLSTLRFLLANINLSEFNLSNKEKEKWESIIIENDEIIDKYREGCSYCEILISGLEKEISQIASSFEGFYSRNSGALDSLLNNIHFGIIFFAEKQEEVKFQIPELTTKTENNSQSIADIITNLQYQDIIRQKIEHIQKSHKSIQNELQQLYELDSADVEKETQLLQKIKDIASLQAAILVKANKEYQQAIEKITKKFLEIGDDMLAITTICMKLNSSNDDTEEAQLTGMLNRLTNSEHILSEFVDRSKFYINQIEPFNIKIQKVNQAIVDLLLTGKQCNSSTKSIISFFQKCSDCDQNIYSTLKHIESVYTDINDSENIINALLFEIKTTQNELLVGLIQSKEIFVSNKLISSSIKSINSILAKLKEKSVKINLLLDENVLKSTSTIGEIKESIKRVSYYDLFEKTINKIILELNEIHYQLRGKIFDDSKRVENLNTMKKLYTMKTEHDIHNRVILKDDDNRYLDDHTANDEKSKDTDEVELF